MVKPKKPDVHHNATGSRRFKCTCGRTHDWPRNPKPGKRVPDLYRYVMCECCVMHTR